MMPNSAACMWQGSHMSPAMFRRDQLLAPIGYPLQLSRSFAPTPHPGFVGQNPLFPTFPVNISNYTRFSEADSVSCFDTATYTSFLRRPSSFYTAAESTATYSCIGIQQQESCHSPSQENYLRTPESIYGNNELIEDNFGAKEHPYVNGDFQRRLLEAEERLRKEDSEKGSGSGYHLNPTLKHMIPNDFQTYNNGPTFSSGKFFDAETSQNEAYDNFGMGKDPFSPRTQPKTYTQNKQQVKVFEQGNVASLRSLFEEKSSSPSSEIFDVDPTRSRSRSGVRTNSRSPKSASRLGIVSINENQQTDESKEIEGEDVPQNSLPEFEKVMLDVSKVEIGTMVELHLQKTPFYGVVKWIGNLPHCKALVKMAGIELEEEMDGAGNGWHNGTLYFKCPMNKGVFVPFTHFQYDKRFESPQDGLSLHDDCNVQTQTQEINQHFGNLECPRVPGSYPPLSPTDINALIGRNKGIQGHQNSCYLDATLFAMFSFTWVFDCILFRPQTSEDIPEYSEVQRVLLEEIINPLRQSYFVRADKVLKLRQLLTNLSSVTGLMSEEKDPEEFLTSLLSQTLRVSPFLELSSGQSSHLFQLFVERDQSKYMPTVQDLFEQSFMNSGIKLSKTPSVLILQMPRFGKQFKVYDRILPSKFLDVTDVLEDSPRQCIVCCNLATYECIECFGEHSEGLDGTVFCENCLNTLHSHQKRQNHKWSTLKVPSEFCLQSSNLSDYTSSRIVMELFAIVCIETSHYVSFVKCGPESDEQWCLFDSMADRKGDQNGYNIPEVTLAPSISHWLSDDGVTFLNNCKDEKSLPEHARRLICDAYMCFYQSPDIMMYR